MHYMYICITYALKCITIYAYITLCVYLVLCSGSSYMVENDLSNLKFWSITVSCHTLVSYSPFSAPNLSPNSLISDSVSLSISPSLSYHHHSFQSSFSFVHACYISRVQLFATPWTLAHQAPLSMGFSRQECWSGLPCLLPGDLPYPWMEPASFMSPVLAVKSLPLVPPGKPLLSLNSVQFNTFLLLRTFWVQGTLEILKNKTAFGMFTVSHWRQAPFTPDEWARPDTCCGDQAFQEGAELRADVFQTEKASRQRTWNEKG